LGTLVRSQTLVTERKSEMLRKVAVLMMVVVFSLALASGASAGVNTANGWYEGEEIYYIDQGPEAGVTARGENDIYLIGGNRLHQAQVVEFVPGEVGYSPHWNAHLVNTAGDTTVADILASPYASALYPEALFDDVEDILGARDAGLVTITQLGVVVLCPIVSEEGAEAEGNVELGITDPFPADPGDMTF
jgi:hypothetical protein